MSTDPVAKDYAGKRAIFESLENSEPPRVHFSCDGKINFMSLRDWNTLEDWTGPMPTQTQA
jgi:hypothetical protein